jgi:hypothetical protein
MGCLDVWPAIILSRRLLDHVRTALDRASRATEHDYLLRRRHPADAVVFNWVYSTWIQLNRSSWLTVSKRAGWSVDICPRISPMTWSSLSPRATNPHSHRISFAIGPPCRFDTQRIATMLV